MARKLKQPHIEQFIAQGHVTLTSHKTSVNFHTHLCHNYPWVPVTQDSVDWGNLKNSIHLNLSRVTDDKKVLEFVKKTRLGQHNHVAVFYTPQEPSLICELTFAIHNLDTIFWSVSGASYLFGVQKKEHKAYKYFFDDFVEWDADDELILSGIEVLS